LTDHPSTSRLAQLKSRWESDPTSRVFLQLAEEYRHQGRVKDALAVLDRGLQEHPGYLSALVAKGRCHLELGEGEAARGVLERVVKQDATQMVANKLLVRAYLETGEPDRARERLDLYSLLNDSDPEISDLRRQIKMMDRPKEQAPEPSPFELGPPPAAMPAIPADDVFDLGGAAPVRARPEVEDVFSLDEAPAVLAAPLPLPEPEPEPEEEAAGDGDLFPGLATRASRQRYLASWASEGIFEIGPEPAPFTPAPIARPEPAWAAPEPAVEDASWLEEIPPPAEVPAYEPIETAAAEAAPPAPSPPVSEPEPADLWPEEELPALPEPEPIWAPEPPARAPEPVATATLGELYLRQGHADEAERIFREVLEREPDSAAALAGLARVEEARREAPHPHPLSRLPDPLAGRGAPPHALGMVVPPSPREGMGRPRAGEGGQGGEVLDARQLLAGFQPGQAGGGTTARKIFLLSRYLERIRGSRDVP
jgi:tetratricopeptide (TPR) repeat protein